MKHVCLELPGWRSPYAVLRDRKASAPPMAAIVKLAELLSQQEEERAASIGETTD